jgi:predicted nucleic acid-binding protein
MIVLDTNVISELFGGREARQVLAWLDQFELADLFLTSVAIAELVYGAELLPDGRRKDGFRQRIDEIVSAYEGRRPAFADEAAYFYGAISARRRNAGRTIETKDAMIAAICMAHGGTLATRNIKDFAGLDLALVNPFEGP